MYVRILVIKNGSCDTDIEYILNKVNPLIRVDIIMSKNLINLNCDEVIDSYQGIIILGGYQTLVGRHIHGYEFPYLNILIDRTKYWIDHQMNILGICLGAQIINEAIGNKTVKLNSYVSGYDKNIKILIDDKILKDGMINLLPYILSSHYDRIDIDIDKINEKIRVIGTYEINDTPIPYIFKLHNTYVYGVQFHPEITRRIFDKILHSFAFDSSTKQFMIDNEKLIIRASILFMSNWIDLWIKKS